MDMKMTVTARPDLLALRRGAARGAASGLAASWVMNRFQDRVQQIFLSSDEGSGDPATVKGDRAMVAITGRHLADRDKAAAGEVVHYAVGSLTGGLYGVLAEVRPSVSRWRGAAMGIAAATIIDQITVPLVGLARPPWKYSLGMRVDRPVGIAEDLISLAGAAVITGFAALRSKRLVNTAA